MYNFAEWLQIRETFETEVISVAKENPGANVNKLAKLMRARGYNVGSSNISHVINNWKRERRDQEAVKNQVAPRVLNKPKSRVLNKPKSDVKLPNTDMTDKAILMVLNKQPNLDPDQVVRVLNNIGVFVEPWQVIAVMGQSDFDTSKVNPNYDPYKVNYKKQQSTPAVPYTGVTPTTWTPPPKPNTTKYLYNKKEDEPFFIGSDPEVNQGYFNKGTGGGTRVVRSTRYN